MDMDVKLLEAFRAVMENQSVTGAAKVLGLTQPAVSTQIARLEMQVGFELFERIGGRLKATGRGRRFYEEVRTVLGSIEKLGTVAANIRSGATETLVVASHPGASISLLPPVVARLLADRPRARVRMINRTSEEVVAIFEAGGADIGIAEWPLHLQGVELRRHALACVAILPEGHRLAERARIAPADLSGEPFVAMSETRLIGHRVRGVFGEAGAHFAPVAESEYFSTICGLVAAGCGVSVVDKLSATSFAPMGLVARPFDAPIRYHIGVFRRNVTAPTPLSDDLLGLIEDVLARNAPERDKAGKRGGEDT